MERWLLTLESNCADPARETEFNEWYDRVHLPDVLETPGIMRASRYQSFNPPEGQPKFLAVYEAETEDFNQLMAAFSETVNSIFAKGRMSELAVVVGMRIYKQITPPIEGRKTS